MRTAVAKVQSDFEGARKHWPDIREWVFVTNYLDVPMQITQEIRRIQGAVTDCKLRTFGRTQFERAILGLPEPDIEDLLSNDATDDDFRSVQPQEILAVVAVVMNHRSERRAGDEEPVVVPFEKLEFNGLEVVFKDRMLSGFKNARSVERLLRNHVNPLLEGDLAAVYKAKYLDLDCQGLTPGEIMDELYDFTLAGERGTTHREVAVWSVLAYMFETCTIFKDRPFPGLSVEAAA